LGELKKEKKTEKETEGEENNLVQNGTANRVGVQNTSGEKEGQWNWL